MWGQCSKVMQEKLEAKPAFAAIKQNVDSLLLLELIRGVSFKFDGQKCPFGSLHFAMKQIYNLKQNADESDSDFHERLDNAVEQDEMFQALIALEQASSNDRKAAEKRNGEQFLAFCAIAKADYKQCSE